MSALLPLRDYQIEAIKDLHSRWDKGDTRVPLVLATGLGKTVIFAHLIADWVRSNVAKRVMVLVHTDELVQQAAKKIKDVAPKLHVGVVKAERNEVTARVIVASVQSLRSAKRRDQIRNVGMIIVDECFPAGTMVGDKRIEDLKPGDLVPSWDEKTGEVVMRPVVRLTKKDPSAMVRVSMSDGASFACTPNHPVLTSGGWQLAGWLSRGERVVSFTHDATVAGNVHRVREHLHLDGQSKDRRLSAIGPDVLHGRVQGRMGGAGSVGQNGADEPQVCFGAHEGAQSDGATGGAREDGGHAEADQPSTSRARRQREAGSGAAASAIGTTWMAHGAGDRAERWRDALALQSGHRAPNNEGAGGGGWGVPLLAGTPSLRSSQGRTVVTARVVDVQVLKPGCDGTYGGVCSDGFVYNIEVAGTHTYLIGDGVVVHNCHHAVAKTYRDILEHYGAMQHNRELYPERHANRPLVAGFTATLARGDKQKLSDVWQECTFSRGIAFGIRRGYLLDVRGKRIVVPDLDLSTVKKSGGDYQDAGLAEELDRSLAPSVVASAYVEHALLRKGLLFAPTVASAHHFAEAFTEAGIPSAVVHGGTPREERRLILKKLHTGEIQVVHNCGVLTEGFDEPTVSCVVNARPTQSAPLYQQMVGRGLRPNLSLPPEARGDCLVLDVVGVSRTHNLRTLIDLSERAPSDLEMEDGESLLELEEALDALEEAEKAGFEDLEPEEYQGPVTAEDFDPLARTGVGAWLRTAGGTFFLPVGNQAYVLIVESAEPNLFDVAWLSSALKIFLHFQCPGREPYSTMASFCLCGGGHTGSQGDLTEHQALPLDMACSWAEEVLEDLGGAAALSRAGARAGWRKRKVSYQQEKMLLKYGIVHEKGWKFGDANDRIDEVIGSRRIDPVVAFLQASRSPS